LFGKYGVVNLVDPVEESSTLFGQLGNLLITQKLTKASSFFPWAMLVELNPFWNSSFYKLMISWICGFLFEEVGRVVMDGFFFDDDWRD